LSPSLLLLAIGVVVVLAYLAAWRSAGKRTRKVASLVTAWIAGLAASIAFSFAVTGLRTFFDHETPLWRTLVGEGILWAIAISLGIFATRSIGTKD
jgi:hypothetical protein